MSESPSARTDTSDMMAIHEVFRTTLPAAPSSVHSALGDPARRALLANYYANVIAFLEVHHEGEEQLLFPLLSERAPDARAEVETAVAGHHAVVSLVGAAKGAVATWDAEGDQKSKLAVSSLTALADGLAEHLAQEEESILPLASEHVTPEEWGRLPGHGLANFTGDKVWLILGLIREQMTPEQRAAMLEHMAPPAREMWETMGEAAFRRLIDEVRRDG